MGCNAGTLRQKPAQPPMRPLDNPDWLHNEIGKLTADDYELPSPQFEHHVLTECGAYVLQRIQHAEAELRHEHQTRAKAIETNGHQTARRLKRHKHTAPAR
jgi:hypothetical protein